MAVDILVLNALISLVNQMPLWCEGYARTDRISQIKSPLRAASWDSGAECLDSGLLTPCLHSPPPGDGHGANHHSKLLSASALPRGSSMVLWSQMPRRGGGGMGSLRVWLSPKKAGMRKAGPKRTDLCSVKSLESLFKERMLFMFAVSSRLGREATSAADSIPERPFLTPVFPGLLKKLKALLQ